LADEVRNAKKEREIMTFEMPFKEIYIHLPENDPAFVCTVRYGGLPGKATRVPLEVPPACAFEQEESSIVRTRSRFGPGANSV
jgi:hypothetical protein